MRIGVVIVMALSFLAAGVAWKCSMFNECRDRGFSTGYCAYTVFRP